MKASLIDVTVTKVPKARSYPWLVELEALELRFTPFRTRVIFALAENVAGGFYDPRELFKINSSCLSKSRKYFYWRVSNEGIARHLADHLAAIPEEWLREWNTCEEDPIFAAVKAAKSLVDVP